MLSKLALIFTHSSYPLLSLSLVSNIDSNEVVRRNVVRIISNGTCIDPETAGVNLAEELRSLGALTILIDMLSDDNKSCKISFCMYFIISQCSLKTIPG